MSHYHTAASVKIQKRCRHCGLPETFPGVKFGSDGICNYCVYFEMYRDRDKNIKAVLKREFVKLIMKTKKQKNKYDCIVAYSGGKDSTFLLYLLKNKFDLKILAHVLDNGFVSQTAKQNIKRVTKALDIDYRITTPDFETLREVFSFALTERIPYPKEILSMLSQVCAVCIAMVFGTTINLATKLRIPLMFVGLTPGQYPAITLENFLKVKSCMFISERVYKDDPLDVIKIFADPIREKFGDKVNKYFFRSQYIEKGRFVPKILLPYHALVDYDEQKILKKIKNLGWQKPLDTDSCSTNCLLNALGNISSKKQFGYHPYTGELSYLVREGKITAAQALRIEQSQENPDTTSRCLKKLGIEIL